MDYNFSDRIKDLDGTATREIFKLLSRPEIISFAGGLPANEYLPVDIVKQLLSEIMSDPKAKTVLQYGVTEGFLSFRTELLKYVEDFSINGAKLENILVISGGQQGIDLMLKTFINKGDVILVENPTYLAFLQLAKTYEGICVGVNADGNGLDINDLEEKIKKHRPKLLYCVPTFSNPTGKTYSEENRRQIALLTAKYGVMVLEDDPYSKLRFEGESVPSLKSFDKEGNVVFITSFSKILAPGLRTGVAVGNERVIRKMTIGKQGTDLHTSSLAQLVAERYLKGGYMKENISKSLPLYKSRKDAMLAALDKHMPDEYAHTRPEGGLFIWGRFDKTPLDVKAILPEAIQNDVAYIQGSEFFANAEEGKSCIRLNFSNESLERIEKGIKALGGLYKRKIAEYKG